MNYGVISTPAKLIMGSVLLIIILVVVGQLLLVLFDYSVERLYINKNIQIIKNEMQENGGLVNYNTSGRDYNHDTPSSAVDTIGGTGKGLSTLYNDLQHRETQGYPLLYAENNSNLYKFSSKEKEDVVDESLPHFFTRSEYSFEVDYNSARYVGSEVKVVLHRDLAFNMIWGKPWIIHLKEEAVYVHDTQYTPSKGIGRVSGKAFVS